MANRSRNSADRYDMRNIEALCHVNQSFGDTDPLEIWLVSDQSQNISAGRIGVDDLHTGPRDRKGLTRCEPQDRSIRPVVEDRVWFESCDRRRVLHQPVHRVACRCGGVAPSGQAEQKHRFGEGNGLVELEELHDHLQVEPAFGTPPTLNRWTLSHTVKLS